jgi:hemoglobin-like flavoprotein
MDPNSPDLLQSKRFSAHASHFVSMIDTTVNMLGPDIEMLTEIMLELGAKHVRYGVTPQMFPVMEQCLLQTIEECLTTETEHGSSFHYTQDMRDSWVEVYHALSNDMIRALRNSK